MSETTTRTTSRTLEMPGTVLAYDVRDPRDDESDLPPLVVMGSPMAASGFGQLVDLLDDRVVVTYDPRGTERSTLAADGEVSVERHADDLHEVVAALGLGPVDVFGSSGGGVVGLSWIERHPEDVRTFVAHEPPITPLLEDAETATAVQADVVETYRPRGLRARDSEVRRARPSHVRRYPRTTSTARRPTRRCSASRRTTTGRATTCSSAGTWPPCRRGRPTATPCVRRRPASSPR